MQPIMGRRATDIGSIKDLRFAKAFGKAAGDLAQFKAFNSNLDCDTPRAIDPLLLARSSQQELASEGVRLFNTYFSEVAKLLSRSKSAGDRCWREAESRFVFPEISETCLGFGQATTRGAGLGAGYQKILLTTAKEIVDLGVDDPAFFTLLGLLEKGIGPDRISDMTTNVVLPALVKYTQRVCRELQIATKKVQLKGQWVQLPVSPKSGRGIVLVPTDVLRRMPIAQSWDDMARVTNANEVLKRRVNRHISALLRKGQSAEALKAQALSSKEAFEALLAAMKATADAAQAQNPLDLFSLVQEVADSRPLSITATSPIDVVQTIVAQFKTLVEDNALSHILWENDKPRPEKTAQGLFFAVAHSYCQANDLDVTPEANEGHGPVDFKFSKGANAKIVVEVKLSTNSGVVSGYTGQLEVYKRASGTTDAFYLVIDVGKLGKKYERLLQTRNEQLSRHQKASRLELIDALRKASASKVKGPSQHASDQH